MTANSLHLVLIGQLRKTGIRRHLCALLFLYILENLFQLNDILNEITDSLLTFQDNDVRIKALAATIEKRIGEMKIKMAQGVRYTTRLLWLELLSPLTQLQVYGQEAWYAGSPVYETAPETRMYTRSHSNPHPGPYPLYSINLIIMRFCALWI